MSGLSQIFPTSETVEIRGMKISVGGIGLAAIAQLLNRFPNFRKMMSGQETDLSQVISGGDDFVAALIAAGTGEAGDPEAERIASVLSIDEQVSLLEPILRLTLPEGVGPFVAKLNKLGAVLNAGLSDGRQSGATISPSPLNS